MLNIHRLSFYFKEESPVLNDITFNIQAGEILTVLGESGSGKSTLLKLIYGLEDAVSGEIFYNSEKVTGRKFNLVPGNPNMKFVPQEFDLLDSITVAENVGKYLSNFDLPLKREATTRALNVVKMEEFAQHFPSQLSGGQRQRVAIARAIAAEPKMLLLDEPYSHLDQPLKNEIRKSIWKWAKKKGCTVILTTHDIEDALGFSDKIIILKGGKIIQNDSPERLRNSPENEYVASLLGEYSVLNSEEMKKLFNLEIPENKNAIIYPEEIVESKKGTEFQISNVYYRGRDYLVEAKRGSAILKLYADKRLESETIELILKDFRLI